MYGKKNKFIDVTLIFKNYFMSGQTSMIVSNKLFGDPYRGIVKELRITFVNGSVSIYNESKTVYLKDITISTTIIKTSNIVSARYGKNYKTVDVTNIVKNNFSQGYPQITVSNSMFGDPCVGVVKELRLTLINNIVKIFTENSLLKITDISV
jgi:hypothetical protein